MCARAARLRWRKRGSTESHLLGNFKNCVWRALRTNVPDREMSPLCMTRQADVFGTIHIMVHRSCADFHSESLRSSSPLSSLERVPWSVARARAATDGVDGIARRRRALVDTRSSSRLVHRATPRRAQTRWQVVRLLQRRLIGVSVEEAQVETQRQGRELSPRGTSTKRWRSSRRPCARSTRWRTRRCRTTTARRSTPSARCATRATRARVGRASTCGCARRRGGGGGRDRPSRSREGPEGPHRRRVLLPHGRGVPPARAARPVRARVRASVGVGPAT